MMRYGKVTRIWEPGKRHKIWLGTEDGGGCIPAFICIYVSEPEHRKQDVPQANTT